ncbi:TrbM/KikA/MpfK family conjugal transfer protein [Duganella rhizosphaerae]|uniref:TrbM/KikA/MpfK family conjugal transfer protein n=1 Tax=Duganella rhizosphaerae TaxID=2885763 RepID=UPI00403FBA20
MKPKRIIAALAVVASTFAVQSANAQDLSALAALACEATLCLSTGQPPTECTPSLNKYFSIAFKQPWKTIQARGNFLKLCPDVQGGQAQKMAEQSVSQSERDEAGKDQAEQGEAGDPQSGAATAQPPKEQIKAALDSLTPLYDAQAQQSVAARQVLESCIAQQGAIETGHCQAEKADFDAKRAPAITLRAEITRLETMLGSAQ